jgi:hypothetical protein
MNKSIVLGVAEVSFSHHYEPKHELNSKTNETHVVKVPKATTVVIKANNLTVSAKVVCSHRDTFSFEKGRKAGLRKAIALTTLNKEDRTRLWADYNKLKPGGRW